jgi:hypothetical protein
VEVSLGRGVAVAMLVAVYVFDATGDALGVAVLTAGFVAPGDTNVSGAVEMGFAIFRRPEPENE